jgi:hypothetical protein
VVLAPDDVGDLHVGVVDDVGQMKSGWPLDLRTLKSSIVEFS